jgi:UDP-N-acetyl-D-mannosaminuronic acid dehydrogenase
MNVAVVGGCGHVGLPLALALADSGLKVVSYDISQRAVEVVNAAQMPFMEDGADEVLQRVLASGDFRATTDPQSVSRAEYVVVVVGTPVDEHLNPKPEAVVQAVRDLGPYLRPEQLLVLRSTVFPGVTAAVEKALAETGLEVRVAFCPERIAEGFAMKELFELPQIVGVRDDEVFASASRLFGALGVKVHRTTPEEAELAKLFTNSWRYIKFAAANQFWMMANDAGLDFTVIREAIRADYPRAADLPGPGFAAGPCLFKDTMQLGAYSNNAFVLGHSAMLVNEGQPLYIADRLAQQFDLASSTVGILGMAFKGESDDTRSSLSYKLKRILRFRAREVLCTDPFVSVDPDLLPRDEVIDRSDILIIAAPHVEYRRIETDKPVVDIWNTLGHGSRV